MLSGVLLIDKPEHWTSFDVVNKIRHIIQDSDLNTTQKKRFPVGHTGTLDPLATGLLVILVGDYTKRAMDMTKLDKTYEVVMKLGETSTTDDEEGEKTVVSTKKPTNEQVQTVLKEFIGDIMQTPPAYSAIKINGKRAYKLARAGKPPKLEPRPVTIYSLSFKSYDYPYINFYTDVSSGTYIRSLVNDIGNKLNTGAYLKDLRRTKVGDFNIDGAIKIDQINQNILDSLLLK